MASVSFVTFLSESFIIHRLPLWALFVVQLPSLNCIYAQIHRLISMYMCVCDRDREKERRYRDREIEMGKKITFIVV